MNQRREIRYPLDHVVTVTVFGTPDLHLQCRIHNASGRGIALEVADPLASGTPLKITLEDAILLGEVIYCRAHGEKWVAGVELEHALCGLAELAAALRGFNEPGSSAEREHTVQNTGRQDQQ
jgi:hypothetical protein